MERAVLDLEPELAGVDLAELEEVVDQLESRSTSPPIVPR